MIYVVKHKEDEKKYPPGYKELKVGKISDHLLEDNIEHLNPFINELTGLYYIWKNTKDDIVGLCHYRRVFVEDGKPLSWEMVVEKANSCDIVVSRSTTFQKPIRENLRDHFCVTKDVFDKYYNIITSREPGLREFWETDVFHPNNIFIARREIADGYCKWLFPLIVPIAEQFSWENNNGDAVHTRMVGYMSERLLSYYILKNGLYYEGCEVGQW